MPENIDLDGDGEVEQNELDLYIRRRNTQRNFAIVAMASLVIMGAWIGFFATETRLQSIGALLDLFWITMGGIIATYMGAEAYSDVNKN